MVMFSDWTLRITRAIKLILSIIFYWLSPTIIDCLFSVPLLWWTPILYCCMVWLLLGKSSN